MIRRKRCFGLFVGAALVAVSGVGSCADTGQLRLDEQALAVYVKQLQESADTFAKDRTTVAKAREQDIATIRVDAAELLGNVAQSYDAWKLSKDKRLELLVDLRAIAESAGQRASDTESEKEAGRKAIEAAKSRVSVKLERLGAAAKSLATLADGHDREMQLRFVANYFKEVLEQVRQLEDQSKSEMKAATSESNSVTNTVNN